MIRDHEFAALAEGARRAAANGHDVGAPAVLAQQGRPDTLWQGISIVTLTCRHCPADVALLKGDPRCVLTGAALARPCPGAGVATAGLPRIAPPQHWSAA